MFHLRISIPIRKTLAAQSTHISTSPRAIRIEMCGLVCIMYVAIMVVIIIICAGWTEEKNIERWCIFCLLSIYFKTIFFVFFWFLLPIQTKRTHTYICKKKISSARARLKLVINTQDNCYTLQSTFVYYYNNVKLYVYVK